MINDNGQCIHLSTTSLTDIVVNLQSIEEPAKGLSLDFVSPDQCNETSKYKLNV
jgi:hypothetical protein